ncbi:hypothetical protein C8T65DRAFT_294234 [Cerioporus squamosus]|nr:hypothetical protein C8T65DRAFT_294234 [Cerioporus squamosus]
MLLSSVWSAAVSRAFEGLLALDTCRRVARLNIRHAANVRCSRRHRVFFRAVHYLFGRCQHTHINWLAFASPCFATASLLGPSRTSAEHQQEMGGGGLEGGAKAEPRPPV